MPSISLGVQSDMISIYIMVHVLQYRYAYDVIWAIPRMLTKEYQHWAAIFYHILVCVIPRSMSSINLGGKTVSGTLWLLSGLLE